MLRRRMMIGQSVSLPAGYTKLEYLESNGAQYIDTGFKPNNNTRVCVDYQSLSREDSAIAAVIEPTYYYTLFVDEGKIGTRYGTQAFQYFGANAPAWGDRLVYDKNKNITTAGGLTVTHIAETFQLIYSLTLFARNNAGKIGWLSKARLYSCQIYDNGTLVRDYVPAMNASGETGLYDLKNDVWYGFLKAVAKVENKVSIRSVFSGYTQDGSWPPPFIKII